MATATALGLQVALRCHDVGQIEITAAQYLSFINMAIDDLTAAGWLQPQTEDESITLSESDYDYNVPSGFAYIKALIVADENGQYPAENTIPHSHFRISLDAADTPEIYFFPDSADFLIGGRALKIIGQKRPAQSVSGSDTIVPGMEAFVRERSTHYALEFLSDGQSGLSQARTRRMEQTWAKSQAMLGNHPMEFRVRPSSIYVLGR